jgi:hypothetical protein
VRTCAPPPEGGRCLPAQECDLYDDTRCGFQYSDAEQASNCEVLSPSIWPALFQVPSPGYLAHPYSPAAAMLVTAEDPAALAALQLFPNPQVAPAAVAAATAFAALGQESVSRLPRPCPSNTPDRRPRSTLRGHREPHAAL